MHSFLPEHYPRIHQPQLSQRWFKPADLEHALRQLPLAEHFEIQQIGSSFEKRPLHAYTYGHGPKRLLLWSQMHGNEPTATHALLELFHLFGASFFAEQGRYLKEALTICFIPMLNPDGAERFTRHNAQLIDLNRDALARQSAEMQHFFAFVERYKPHWAFNLHDQRNIFNCGHTDLPATLSFLAPSADPSRKMTPEREMSMALIARLVTHLAPYAKDYMARFTDEYYPKALGEFFHRNQIPCVLIESGPAREDPLRLKARKLNVLLLLDAFMLVAGESIGHTLKAYHDLPLNRKNNLDIVLRDTEIVGSHANYKADIGLLLNEIPDMKTGQLERIYAVEEVGDLSHKGGLEVFEEGLLKQKGDGKFLLGQPAHFSYHQDNTRLEFENGALV